MANFKCSFFFETPDAEGWSESFYLAGATIDVVEPNLTTVILPARLAMLPTDMQMIYGRVSDVTVKGDSLVCNTPFPKPGTYDFTGFSLLEANTALLAILFATPLIKNRIFIRGLSSDVVAGREYQAPSAFDTAFTSWGSALLANGLVARHRTAVGPPPTYSYTAVTTVSVNKATARKPGRPFGLPVGRRRHP